MTLMLFAVGLSSTLMLLLGVRVLSLKAEALPQSVGRMFEWAGLIAVFLGVNLVVGAVVTTATRTVGGSFMSAYPLGDFVLPVISLIQATLFQFWRTSTAASADR